MAEFPQSREEAILQATINGEEYTGYPESRIEALLLELKAVIESGGGGGGGTTNYNLLENKPQIGGVTLTGDKSASDLSLASTSRLADAENMVCAEFFDASKAYAKDTYVIYNDGLYKFKSAHTAGVDWDATIVDEVDLLTVIQEATNPTIAPPVLNKESVVSENDVNSLSAILTAQQTSAYMLILSICNSESFPTLTTCTVSVNLEAKTVSDYYVSEGYGIASKYVLLNLEAGDSIAATIASNVDVFGTSASIMLVRLSSSINGLTLKDAEFSNSYVDPTLNFNVEKDAVYLLWFFNRSDGVGTFKTLKKNNANITTNKIVCSSGSGWQISHGMCMVYAKALDTFAVAIQFNGYFDAVGVFEVLMDTGESYNDLKDKPQINGVTLSGNKSLSDLSIPTALASLTDDATHRTVTDAEKSAWNTTGEAIETEKTASGNPITVTDALPYPAVSLSAEIEAEQDLHGYDHPWVGGAGKNFADYSAEHSSSIGNTYTFNEYDGWIKEEWASGNQHQLVLSVHFVERLRGNKITISITSADISNQRMSDWRIFLLTYSNGGSESIVATLNPATNLRSTITLNDNITEMRILLRMSQNNAQSLVAGDNIVFHGLQLEVSESPTSYAPYSNICPISGRDSAVLTRSDGDEISEDFTIQLGTTVYGADINWDTGVMTVTHGYIASYNGETIGEPWISSMDEYTQGGTPTTGAQVVYPLATPTTIQLTPTQLEMLKGYNRLSSDGGGDITLTYKADAIEQANMYSEDEVEIGTWLGKKLYRKVFDVGALPNNATKTVASGLSNITVVKIYGIAYSAYGSALPLPYIGGDYVGLYYVSNNNITIVDNSDRSSNTGKVILEYTKN